MASMARTMASAPGWPPSPMASSTMKITTSPADGTDAAPIEASSAVITATACAPSDRSNPMAWAMNSAPTHSKIAVPSMLTVAPMGRTNDEILFETPTRSSAVRIVTGERRGRRAGRERDQQRVAQVLEVDGGGDAREHDQRQRAA